jgi:hypothetical protein
VPEWASRKGGHAEVIRPKGRHGLGAYGIRAGRLATVRGLNVV